MAKHAGPQLDRCTRTTRQPGPQRRQGQSAPARTVTAASAVDLATHPTKGPSVSGSTTASLVAQIQRCQIAVAIVADHLRAKRTNAFGSACGLQAGL